MSDFASDSLGFLDKASDGSSPLPGGVPPSLPFCSPLLPPNLSPSIPFRAVRLSVSLNDDKTLKRGSQKRNMNAVGSGAQRTAARRAMPATGDETHTTAVSPSSRDGAGGFRRHRSSRSPAPLSAGSLRSRLTRTPMILATAPPGPAPTSVYPCSPGPARRTTTLQFNPSTAAEQHDM